jgi:hypothetical protein
MDFSETILSSAKRITALAVIVCSSLTGTPMIHATAGIYPSRVQAGQPFQLTVHVLDSAGSGSGTSPGLVAATITWPDWGQHRLVVTEPPSSSVRSSSIAGAPAVATSFTISLQAAAVGRVEIPSIRVQGVTGSATTEPLPVMIEASIPATPSAAPVRPGGSGSSGPQTLLGHPPLGTGSVPGAAAPSGEPRPEATAADESGVGRLQMTLGAAAFYIFVGVIVVVAAKRWRGRAARPPK